MKYFNKIIIMACSILMLSACADDGEYDHPIVKDRKPEIPVLFSGATTYGANPYYETTLSGTGAIQITISIPTSSPLKIKEITKMIAGATGITPGNVNTASVANYLSGPIAVDGYETTISTSVSEFNSKVAATARVTPTVTPATATSIPAGGYAERAFMFLVTLEDGTTIIPQQLRIRVTP
jgi:hypothetical protein